MLFCLQSIAPSLSCRGDIVVIKSCEISNIQASFCVTRNAWKTLNVTRCSITTAADIEGHRTTHYLRDGLHTVLATWSLPTLLPTAGATPTFLERFMSVLASAAQHTIRQNRMHPAMTSWLQRDTLRYCISAEKQRTALEKAKQYPTTTQLMPHRQVPQPEHMQKDIRMAVHDALISGLYTVYNDTSNNGEDETLLWYLSVPTAFNLAMERVQRQQISAIFQAS